MPNEFVIKNGFVSQGNSTINGTLLTNSLSGSSTTIYGNKGNVILSGDTSIALITVNGTNTVGGSNYCDFLRVTNTTSGATNINKTFRLNNSGGIEIINSQYTGTLFSIGENGNVSLSGSVSMPNRPAFRVVGVNSDNIVATTTITGGTIDYNQGGYYNNSTGVFTAPISGLYQVFLNLRTGSAGSQQAIIIKNNSTNLFMWETNTNSGHFGVGGVINLSANDTLKVNVTVGTTQFDVNDSWGVAYIG